MLVALVAVYGVFEAFFRPAAGGLIPQVAGPEHLQQANALMGLAQNVGTVLGPTLGGLLVVTVGPGAAIGVDALSFLVSAIFLIRMGSLPAQRAADAVSRLLGRAARRRRRGPPAALDVDVHARADRLPPDRAALRARARPRDRRPRARRRRRAGP